MRRRTFSVLACLAVGAIVPLAGCGSSSTSGPSATASVSSPPPSTAPTRIEVVKPGPANSAFDPAAIYRQEAPGVVTVTSVFSRGGSGGPQGGLGSGFVISASGEIATNAHVVTNGTGASIRQAPEVYVAFADGNRVPAHVVGYDPNADVALLRVDPHGLTLRPLPLGSSAQAVVGSPVVAMGSPFGEAQSLSTGVISATGRSIDSLTGFQISGALQTDAAINHGNSGGPLLNAAGEVLGINSQIASSSGGGEGVGFSVPVDTVRRSLDQLRRFGHVRYAYLGISTTGVFPQLANRFGLPVSKGAYVQTVNHGSPAARAGLRAGTRTVYFEAQDYRIGGDVITQVASYPVTKDVDLADALSHYLPGDTVSMQIWRGGSRQTVSVKLGERPVNSAP